MFGKLIKGLVTNVVVPIARDAVKQAARQAAEEALTGVIEKRIGPKGKILTDVLGKIGNK